MSSSKWFSRRHGLSALSAFLSKHGNSNNFLVSYFFNHINSMLISLDRLVRAPVASFLTIIVIGIALALPFGLEVLLQNVKRVSQNWDAGTQLSLYLRADVTDAETKAAMRTLESNSKVVSVRYISPEDGLQELQKNIDLSDIAEDLKENPLPAVIVVTPKHDLVTPGAINGLLNEVRHISAVDTARLDKVWVERLYYIIDFGRRAALMLLTLFGLGVIFIVGNTIRLNMQAAHKEIAVFKLVGATDAFVRRPYLYTGFYYGLMGAAVAWAIITAALQWLSIPVHNLAFSYGSNFTLSSLDLHNTIYLLATGALFGLVGARLAIAKHLRKY